ncbi:MAG: N-6 DNA methylase [Candidatus Aminicenantes bacterium]|nr:N-6 DNA methylase [Candidatus Aminicenantes bacterium]
MPYSKEQAKGGIGKLVEDFQKNKARLLNQAEAQIENNFIRPLFKYLNWNTTNEGLSVADYEFVVNRTGRGGKRPDYTLQLDGQHLLVMDAKQVKYDMHDPRWLNQVYAYGYSTQNLAPVRRIDFAILTDFEEFVVLDCTLHVNDPKALRNFLVLNWTCDDFVNQFDRLWDLLERENLRRHARTRQSDTPRGLWALALSPRKVKANRMPPDKAFLADMDNDQNGWRVRLAKDMKKLNPAADGALITAAVQLLIDRLIFIKALSDREIEDDYLDQLAATVESDGLDESDSGWFAACGKIFEKLNRFYNGNVFKPRPELEAVTVANKTVRDIIRSLQPENSPYNFAVLPVEILGTIYERFLGRVVRTTEQRVKIEEKPEVRKAGGVYYTPQYIVEYIVKNTVGKLLENCKAPADVSKLKILDPACGSGSFLVGAYAALIDWHIKYFDTKKRLSAADRADAYYDSDGRVRLTARLKRQILLNNLFGVDIDQQAVEVSRFSLSLKALEDTRREELYEERSLFKETVLPDLNDNIKCGNSLIGPDYFSGKMFPDSEELRRVNPFDWQREFPTIFTSGGFDAVIGNPPYIRMEGFKEIKFYLKSKYLSHSDRADIFYYFVEKVTTLLKSNGQLGFILSNTFVRSRAGKSLRSFIVNSLCLETLVDFGDFTPFLGATVYPIIIIAGKSSSKSDLVNFIIQDCDPVSLLPEEQFPVILQLERKSFNDEAWIFESSKTAQLRSKLFSEYPSLLEVYGEVCRGIVSGYNEGFLLSEKERENILTYNNEANKIIKPYVGGKDLDHYYCNWDDTWIIYTPHGIDMSGYPKIIEHLSTFKPELLKRATQQAWYELQQPQEAYVDLFDKPKIIFPDISRYPKFCLDTQGMYFSNTVYFIKSDSLYLLGLLNSKLLWFMIRGLSNALRGGLWRFRLFSGHVERLPIRTIAMSNKNDKTKYDRMLKLVESMLSLQKHKTIAKNQTEKEMIQRQIDATDREIDQIVYELYGLTEKEIKIVENIDS